MSQEQDRVAYRSNADALAGHPLLARTSHFTGSTLVVVHENDEIIPPQTTDAFIEAFSADTYIAKDFWHGTVDSRNPDNGRVSYQIAISDWINHSVETK